MQNWIINNKWPLLVAIAGAIAGFLYWKYVGCITGTCTITSSPINSTLYGALLGWLTGGRFKTPAKNLHNDEQV